MARQVLPLESPLLHLAASSLCQSLPAGGRRAGARRQAPAQGPAPPSPGQNQEDRRKGCLVPNSLGAASPPAGVGEVLSLLSRNVVTALETEAPRGGPGRDPDPASLPAQTLPHGGVYAGRGGRGQSGWRRPGTPDPPPPPPVALFLGWLCLLGASMNNDDVMMLAVAEASLSAGLPVSREQFSGFTAIPKPVLFLSSCYLWGN